MAGLGFVAKMTYLLGGLLIWAGHFLFVYGFNGLACARGFDRNTVFGFGIVPLTVAGATALALVSALAILAFAASGRGPGIAGERHVRLREFWRLGTLVIAAFSAIAVLWTGLPALIISPCA